MANVVKNKPKKQHAYRYLNIRLDADLYEEFELFCSNYGMSKTGATEVAIKRYMDTVKQTNI